MKGSEARTGFPCLRDSKRPRGERSEPGRQTEGKRQTGRGAEPAESEATVRTWNFNEMGRHCRSLSRALRMALPSVKYYAIIICLNKNKVYFFAFFKLRYSWFTILVSDIQHSDSQIYRLYAIYSYYKILAIFPVLYNISL